MRLHAVVAVLLASHVAAAQPGATPPAGTQPPEGPPLVLPEQQAPAPPVVTPQQPAPAAPLATGQLTMSEKDVEILQRGEISKARMISGGILSVTLGLGLGQIIERRWGDAGWIFTLGEAGSVGLFSYGVVQALSADGHYGGWMILGSVVLYTGFRVWDIVDAFAGPGRHNRRYRELRGQMNHTASSGAVRGFLIPTDRGGGIGGISLTF